MKIFKRKHFQALIYSIFLSLPLLSVLGRCVYTIANKNAYQSYYGETINEEELTSINSSTNLVAGEKYKFINFNLPQGDTITVGQNRVFISSISNVIENATHDFSNVDNFAIYNSGSNTTVSVYFYSGGSYLFALGSSLSSFEFTYQSFTQDSNRFTDYLQSYNFIYSVEYNQYSYLDNAFEYSIDRFVSENDYGEMDFFTWFSSLFLSGNSLDSLYIHFINWYMNYILYVSLGYLIFSVLLWFVNFFRRLVEDSSNINVGGM